MSNGKGATVNNTPMSDEQLEEIDELLHNNEQVPTDLVRLLASEVERLRSRDAALLPIVTMLSACEAVQHPTFIAGGIDGVLLYHLTINVLWMREQARAFLASHPAAGQVAASGEGE